MCVCVCVCIYIYLFIYEKVSKLLECICLNSVLVLCITLHFLCLEVLIFNPIYVNVAILICVHFPLHNGLRITSSTPHQPKCH